MRGSDPAGGPPPNRESHSVSLADIEREVVALTIGAEDGEPLRELTIAFINLGVAMSATTLNVAAGRRAMEDVLRAGGTHEQIVEILLLISALGVHTLFVGMRMAGALAERDGALDLDGPLEEHQEALKERHVGTHSYWRRFEARVPGFLNSLLRLSPTGYQQFFEYCALPTLDPTVSNVDKELVSIATDATPAHRFLPTLRLHVENAVSLGAGRRAIPRGA